MKRIKFLVLSALVFASVQLSQAQVNITESAGWLETAYVKWQPLSGADSYNVYYKGANASDDYYLRIDGMLVRSYADYFRADVVGLQAGYYKIKVVPVAGGVEDESQETVTSTIKVKPHVREGFGFASISAKGTSSGAYNDNGTLPENAQVIYITPETAKTVTLDVITNSKGGTTTCVGIGDILNARKKGYDFTPLAIRIVGNVTASDMSGLNSTGYLEVKGNSGYDEMNITLEGIGDDATVNGWGILIRQCQNVEVRNLGVMLFPDDGVSLDTKNENIWIHNVDFFYGKPGSDSDQAKGDGSLDVKGGSRSLSIAYNHFWDSGKALLCGMSSESNDSYITYHHNWFDHSDSRHPRVRTMSVHVYNNYFDGVAKYGVGATMGSSVFVENNYFRNCKYPMMISKQGTDIFYDATGTFSGENGGMIKSYGNHIQGATRFVDQTFSATEFDAITVSSRDEQVPVTYKTLKGGTTYNNFDTNPSIMYTYNPHTAEQARDTVMHYAGRMNGGDLKFTFTATDDTDYGVNTAIKNAILAYTGKVSTIGYGEETGERGDPGDISNPGPETSVPDTEKVSFSLYPNPVVNNLHIQGDIEVDLVEVYSLSGSLVLRLDAKGKTVDLSDLAKGNYLVKVYTAQGTNGQIIIKQ